jgi:hypothetical protein
MDESAIPTGAKGTLKKSLEIGFVSAYSTPQASSDGRALFDSAPKMCQCRDCYTCIICFSDDPHPCVEFRP